MKHWIIGVFLLIVTCIGCSSPNATSKTDKNVQKINDEIRIAFYNVENLFDIQDDPNTADEDFTPTGRLQWNMDRFIKKIDHIQKVVQSLEYPTLLGFSEIENRNCLNDLVFKLQHNYKYEHYESPDHRGIDVALLYDPTSIQVIASHPIQVTLPPGISEYTTTRDVLYVECISKQTNDTLHVFVNHWPSRIGGTEVSAPKRILLGNIVRSRVDSIFQHQPNAKIIIMGDFNDTPPNPSIYSALRAKENNPVMKSDDLFNPYYQLDKSGEGSHNYMGEWSALDQIIVSQGLLSNPAGLEFKKAHIHKPSFLLYPDPRNGTSPLRTYIGNGYMGGYSDHLPVYITCKVSSNPRS